MTQKEQISDYKELLIKEINNQTACSEIDLTNPIFLYLSKKQAEIYIKTINSKPLLSQLHYPITYLIFKHIEQILSSFDDVVDVIDLGPGLPDKTAPIIDYIQAYKKGLRYIPVDINNRFLNISFDFFKYKQITKFKLNVLFQELATIIEKDRRFENNNNRLFNIGLTFNNYGLQEMINLFINVLNKKSIALIATELIDDLDDINVIKPYKTKEAEEFNFQMLKEIGFSIKDFKYNVSFKEGVIKMGFIALQNIVNEKIKINENQLILTSISHRYYEKELVDKLSENFQNIEIFKNGKSKICLITFKAK